MIGLSFSRCVAEIALGIVDIDNVEKIYSRTSVKDPHDWAKAIPANKVYWEAVFGTYSDEFAHLSDEDYEKEVAKFIAKCEKTAYSVLSRVIQPRLSMNKYPDCDKTFWVETEAEIVWKQAS